MRICVSQKIHGQLQLVPTLGKKKYYKRVSVISKNPSTLSWANACKLGKTCDSISSDDESEANNRSDYVKKSE